MSTAAQDLSAPAFDAYQIDKPHPRLFKYYLVVALLTGPLTPIILLSLYFRYITLHYKFDEDGVSMRWGILFRKEVYLTYRRIQDIHLTRNLIQRWMGLAKISLQTASGSSHAEMAIEGVLEADELRDFLYSRMRGAKNEHSTSGVVAANTLTSSPSSEGGESERRATQALEDIRNSLQTLVERTMPAGEES